MWPADVKKLLPLQFSEIFLSSEWPGKPPNATVKAFAFSFSKTDVSIWCIFYSQNQFVPFQGYWKHQAKPVKGGLFDLRAFCFLVGVKFNKRTNETKNMLYPLFHTAFQYITVLKRTPYYVVENRISVINMFVQVPDNLSRRFCHTVGSAAALYLINLYFDMKEPLMSHIYHLIWSTLMLMKWLRQSLFKYHKVKMFLFQTWRYSSLLCVPLKSMVWVCLVWNGCF